MNNGQATPNSRTASRVLLLDPHAVKLDFGANGRFKAAETPVDDLVESILKNGQLQPIVVQKCLHCEAGFTHEVVAGFRRLMAVRRINDLKLGEGRLAIQAVEVLPTNSESRFKLNVEENLKRRQLSPMDLANQLQRWIQVFHKSKEEVAAIYGKSPSWVSGKLSLLTLSPKHQEMVHMREISWWAGRELAEIPPEERQAILDAIMADGSPVNENTVLRKKRELKRLSRFRARSKAQFVADLKDLSSDAATPDEVRESLAFLLEFLKGKHEPKDLVEALARCAAMKAA